MEEKLAKEARQNVYKTYFKTKKYGANRVANTDFSKPARVCRNCGQAYFKDKRVSTPRWTITKYCSPKCQSEAQRIHKDSRARVTAHRRKNGTLARGSAEANEKISRLTKLAMQRIEVQDKIRQPRSMLSLEHRMKVSDALKGKMPLNNSYDNSGYSNIQRGYYDINGTTMYFRSKWEANYALYLDFLVDHKEIYKWEFEPDTFMFDSIKLGIRSYTPDFKVFSSEDMYEYHEVKGYMDSKSKTKLKRFGKYYPSQKLVLIDSSEYTILRKQIGKLCKFY